MLAVLSQADGGALARQNPLTTLIQTPRLQSAQLGGAVQFTKITDRHPRCGYPSAAEMEKEAVLSKRCARLRRDLKSSPPKRLARAACDGCDRQVGVILRIAGWL